MVKVELDKQGETAKTSSIERELKRVKKIAERFRLLKTVGIEDDNDCTLFVYYLTQRLLRTSIYNSSYILSSPGLSAFSSIPILGKLVKIVDKIDRNDRKSLTALEEKTTTFVDENFKTANEKRHAREIELATNDIVARSTNNGNQATVVFKEKVIDEWGKRWKSQISTLMCLD